MLSKSDKERIILSHIETYDDIVYNYVKNGHTIEETIDNFQKIRIKSMNSHLFAKVSFRYLKNNWNLIDFSKRSNILYVMFLTKRIKDMEWVLKNKHKFNLTEDKLYSILIFRDKLKHLSVL
jgi:hypothetical protein